MNLEHLSEDPLLKIGEKIKILPNHACQFVKLHDTPYAVEEHEVVDAYSWWDAEKRSDCWPSGLIR